jgi:uncharacterized protein YyaL (SSP411 family)
MERESFENDSIAALMNERFVCIKIDREERPDLDDIYMTATQIMTSHGGWPMTVFLDPASRQPFWCGTYFPPESRLTMGIPSLPQVLTNISAAWQKQRADVLEQANQIGTIVRERLSGESAAPESISASKLSRDCFECSTATTAGSAAHPSSRSRSSSNCCSTPASEPARPRPGPPSMRRSASRSTR